VRVPSKTIVITGASDGIGAAAARRLTERGDRVVVIGRSEDKTKSVAADVGADYLLADYADLAQVRALAKCLLERYPRIDVLANNAGGMHMVQESTADGYDKTFQVNYLAPFLLTTLLLDRLVESGASVLNTTSMSHKLLLKHSVDDMCNTQRFGPTKAYAVSKLAVVLFSMELHRRYHAAGISAVPFHPGSVNSNFGESSGSRFLLFFKHTPVEWLVAGTERGSDPLVWLASSTPGVDWKPGVYYSKMRRAKPNRHAHDAALAGALWERSLQLVGD
jgi:NAD(P)-dependent dehydrogenase (short-subunit alcohol dehydrogenase family)